MLIYVQPITARKKQSVKRRVDMVELLLLRLQKL